MGTDGSIIRTNFAHIYCSFLPWTLKSSTNTWGPLWHQPILCIWSFQHPHTIKLWALSIQVTWMSILTQCLCVLMFMSQCQQVCIKCTFAFALHSLATLLGSPVQSHVSTNSQSTNHMAAIQCTLACRLGKDNLLKFKPSIRMGKKGDISDSECSRVVGARQAGLKIQKMRIYWNCHT